MTKGGTSGGGSPSKMVQVAKKLGVADASLSSTMDWNDIVTQIRNGRTVVFLLRDKPKVQSGEVLKERCYLSGGHFITLYGANDDFVIANDPGGNCHGTGEQRMVLSKDYITGVGSKYVII